MKQLTDFWEIKNNMSNSSTGPTLQLRLIHFLFTLRHTTAQDAGRVVLTRPSGDTPGVEKAPPRALLVVRLEMGRKKCSNSSNQKKSPVFAICLLPFFGLKKGFFGLIPFFVASWPMGIQNGIDRKKDLALPTKSFKNKTIVIQFFKKV